MGTFLQIIKDAAAESSVSDEPTVALTSTSAIIAQMVRLLNKVGRSTVSLYPYSEMNREHTFDLATATASYALPGDFDHALYDTSWNRDQYWRMFGPITPQEWQALKSGAISSAIHQRFRIKGITTNQLFIHPTPVAGDDGDTCVFEYQSLNWIRPRTWATATVYAAGSYCFYNGTYYYSASGGTSNGTSPADDVGVTDWTAYTGLYNQAVRDDDVSVLDHELMVCGLKAHYKKEHRFEGWDEDMAEFTALAREAFAKTAPGEVLSLSGRAHGTWPNIAETGYNNYGE